MTRCARVLAFSGLIASSACHAPWTPLQLSFFGHVQWFDEATAVRGLAIGGATRNDDVIGVQLALLDASSHDGGGISTALFSSNSGHWTGVRCGWVARSRDCDGLLIGLVTNPQVASMPGDEPATTRGVQLGGFNDGERLRGLQVGIANHVRQLGGVQLGLVNIAHGGGLQFGLLNFKADGFLPVFPLINF